MKMLQNGSGESCESASTSSIGSSNSHNNANRAPGAQLQHKNSNSLFHNNLTNNNGNGSISATGGTSNLASFPDFTPDLAKQVR